MAVLVIMLTIAVTVEPENKVTKEEFALASNFTTEGLMAAVTLVIAIACAEMFNQSTWQRVWAAESVPAMRKGFFMGSIMVFFLMMFFGVMGMIAYANDPEAYDSFEKFAYLAFFDLLEPLENGWHILTLILVTALAASSIDSLQNGLTCIFSHDLVKMGWSPKWITRALVVVINIPAVYFASEKYDVLSLFLVADIVCATSVFPTLLGLQTNDRGIFKAPTELGAFLGCISGIITVLVNGAVNDVEGGIWQSFWLKNDGICALCGSKTMISFILTPTISFIMTYFFTFLDIKFRGERAREPIFSLAFDQDDTPAKDLESSEDDNEESEDLKDAEKAPVDADADVEVVDAVEADAEDVQPADTMASAEVYM